MKYSLWKTKNSQHLICNIPYYTFIYKSNDKYYDFDEHFCIFYPPYDDAARLCGQLPREKMLCVPNEPNKIFLYLSNDEASNNNNNNKNGKRERERQGAQDQEQKKLIIFFHFDSH